MEDRTRVEWRRWGSEAFAEAAEADVPVLLSLTATWCRPCREMDAETYAEPRIAANVNDDFVPVRVDVDERPRVRDRYNMGGFPATVFLTPDGSVLTGAGYLGPDGMRQVLDSVRERWADRGADAGRLPRALSADEPPAGDLTEEVVGRMAAALDAAYDERAGGWGDGPKFPHPAALEFALKRDREMALRCFDAVGANLLDEYEGGFYRFAAERDWSGIQREKLLDSNAALVRAFANAYLHTGRGEYREPAARSVEYLTTTLWLSESAADGDAAGGGMGEGVGAFAGSQAPGDPETYTLDPSDREGADDPPIDRTAYAGANALAIDALLTYAAYTDDVRARRYAERALSYVRESLLEDGTVRHYDDPESDAVPTCLLSDQARVLRALTTARSVLGVDAIADARSVARETIDRLEDGRSFLDGPSDGVGLVERPLRPLEGNVELADALIDLAVLTDDSTYRAVAREALADFAGASDRLGVQGAGYASTVGRLLEDPLVIRVGGPAGSDIHRAALRVADHEKVVVPAAAGVDETEAVVERGERTTHPAETPAEVAERVGDVLE